MGDPQIAFAYAVSDIDNPFDWSAHRFEKDTADFGILHYRWRGTRLLQELCLPLFYALGYGSDGFYDPKGNEVKSLKGYVVVQKTDLTGIGAINPEIDKKGGMPFISVKEESKVIHWADYVSEEFTKRRIKRLRLGDIISDIERAHETQNHTTLAPYKRNGSYFVKNFVSTKRKEPVGLFVNKFAGVVEENDDSGYDALSVIANHYSLEEEVLISEPLNLMPETNDPEGSGMEFRCVVLDAQVASISRHLLFGEHEIPDYIAQFAGAFAVRHQDVFPRAYIVDIAVDVEKGAVVIECNPHSGSGMYSQNDLGAFLRILMPELPAEQIAEAQKRVDAEEKKLWEIYKSIPQKTVEEKMESQMDALAALLKK